jgi:dolichol-phosphate mannosyltransferase
MASSPRPLRIKEVPYEFRNRLAGESKLDSQAMWDYLMLLLDKLVGRVLPIRFIAFALVGAVGVLLHFAILTLLFRVMALSFIVSQCGASIVAMVSNFSLNNALTFRDKRLKGWRWIKGLALFVVVCGIGAVANVGIASYLFTRNSMWMLAALAGIVVGAVWNYAMSAMYTWGKQKR